MTQFDQRHQQVETQYNAGRDINVYQQPLSLTEAQRKRNRSRMLDRVQAIWIDMVLELSLQGAAQIALELQNKPSATVTPLWHVLREFEKTGRLSSADASIVQVYDHADGEVLILGEPGAGKTTLLLELTRTLLQRARQDETHPIPVVFNLSSWATRRQSLTEWLASELRDKYQVPLPLATEWIKVDQVLPLLDGLDEVAAPHRAACVEAINTYRQAHGLVPTIVCSRHADYLALSTRLLLRTAVVVQPLTPEQIESYLASGDERLETLLQRFHEDVDLQTLASTPLMLNVLVTAYQGTRYREIAVTGSLETKQKQIFATYVQHMLTRRSTATRYTPEQTMDWLSWLAQQLTKHSQTEFYLERIQTDWLPENRLRQSYQGTTRLVNRLIIGLIAGLIAGLTSLLYNGLGNAISDFLSNGLGIGLLFTLINIEDIPAQPMEGIARSWMQRWWQSLPKFLGIGYIMGVLGYLVLNVDPFPMLFKRMQIGEYTQLGLDLIGGLSAGLIASSISALINFVEQRGWLSDNHWHQSHRRILTLVSRTATGLGAGLIAGLAILGITYPPPHVSLVIALIAGLPFGLPFMLVNPEGLEIKTIGGIIWPWVNKWQYLFKPLSTAGLVILVFIAVLNRSLVILAIGLNAGLVVGGIIWPWVNKWQYLFKPLGTVGLVILVFIAVLHWPAAILIFELNAGLVVVLTNRLINVRDTEIKPSEVITWSWGNIWRSMIKSLGLGLTVGLGVGLIICSLFALTSYLAQGIAIALTFGLATGMNVGLIFGLVGGFSGELLDKRYLLTPNQGIRRSVYNGLLIGLVSGLVGGLASGLIFGLLYDSVPALVFSWHFMSHFRLDIGIIAGVIFALVFGSVGGLANGGFAGIKHGILRLLLWQTRSIPWNYPRFLDYAAECILLRKVGGGYIFIHRLLLDYFATLEAKSVSDESAESRNKVLSPRTTSSAPVKSTEVDEHSDLPTTLLAPTLAPVPAEDPPLLLCGHERRPNAHFCGICGSPVPS